MRDGKRIKKPRPIQTHGVFLRLPAAVAEELRRDAKAQHRTLSGHVVALIEAARAPKEVAA